MRNFLLTGAVLALLCGMVPQGALAYELEESFGCKMFGWLVRGIGWCEKITYEAPVVTDTLHTPEAVSKEAPRAMVNERVSPPRMVLGEATSSIPLYKHITSEQVIIEQQGVSEAVLNKRITDLLVYINSVLLPYRVGTQQAQPTLTPDNTLVTREHLIKSLDRVYDQIEPLDTSTITELSSVRFTDTTLFDGNVGIGTDDALEVLTVDGPIYLAASVPVSTTNRLYNFGGDLYWNGSLVTSSTTGDWAGLSGNVYRITGNVGIGTSTPGSALTVVGEASVSDTLTAPLLDAGGQVCNVEAYGAVGDNSTLNDAAIAAAITDCPEGGIVYFPMGQFRITSPIVLDKPVTLRGAYSPRWSYSSTPRSSIRANFGTFSGVAVIHVRDRTISGETNHNNGGRIEHLSIDGGSTGSSVEGIYFEGLVRDWKLTDVDISQVTGNGFEAAVGTGEGNPRGFTIRGLSIYSADGHGFRATALNDSYIDDLLAVGNALRGIYLSSMGETKIANSRAVFNALEGLYIDGASNNGGLTFTDFSTDRNDRHGVRISATGTTTITFNGLLTRRDGPNLGGGSETPYAGVAIIGTTTEKVAPVFITGLSQIVGVDDSGNPPLAPQVGVRATNASYVKVDGQLWGVNDGYTDDGGNDNFIIEDDSVVRTGTAGAQELYTNARKWQATTTGLFYGAGSVSIGSSTGSRLFNIVAPEQAGARFQDTTNDVIFDMRAEDFQAFFGTFSNHQLRFQTNNTSRLTIDINGNIGIGTTSPTAQLHTTGTVRLQAFGAGTLQTDANGNVSVSSDERLKEVLGMYNAGLAEVLAIQPIQYRWNEASGYDRETLYAGFSAQNVALVLPEAVGEDSNGYLTLSDRPILAAVVTAIKELWEQVTGNTERIEALEERVEFLESQLDIPDATEPKIEPIENPPLPTNEPTSTTTLPDIVPPETAPEVEEIETPVVPPPAPEAEVLEPAEPDVTTEAVEEVESVQ